MYTSVEIPWHPVQYEIRDSGGSYGMLAASQTPAVTNGQDDRHIYRLVLIDPISKSRSLWQKVRPPRKTTSVFKNSSTKFAEVWTIISVTILLVALDATSRTRALWMVCLTTRTGPGCKPCFKSFYWIIISNNILDVQ